MAEGGGSKTLLWLGIGCGAFALLGICGLTGLGVWLYVGEQERTARAPLGPSPVAAEEPAPPAAPAPLPDGFRRVEGPGWSFGVPDAWAEIPAPPPATVAVRAPSPVGRFHPNVNLVDEPYDGDGAAYGRANLSQLRRVATVVGHQRKSVAGQSAYQIEAKWPSNMPPSHTIQRYMSRDGRGYVLTCSGGMGSFAPVRGDCEQILDTFRVN